MARVDNTGRTELAVTTTGVVTSVAFTAAPSSVFDVSGSPITGSGTIALSMDNQSANTVLAGPSTGATAAPAFRALVNADVPQVLSVASLQVNAGSLAASAVVEIDSTTKGLLIPSMTTTQRNAIGSPANGLLVYDTSLSQLFQYQGGAWNAFGVSGAGSLTVTDGTHSVASITSLTFSGATISGTSPSATATINGLTNSTNKLSGDVSMTTANTFYDGPSLSLAAGTWMLFGCVLCTCAAFATDFTGKLWDGTTVIASVQSPRNAAAASVTAMLPLSGIVTLGSTTTIKISAAGNNNTCIMRAAAQVNGAGNNAAYLNAVKIG